MPTTQATLESVTDESGDECDDCRPGFPCAECVIYGDKPLPRNCETAADKQDRYDTSPLSEVGQ